MHIGILQTGHSPEELREDIGDYTQMFQRLLKGRGFSFSTWDVVDMAFPASVEAADGWLISGSKHGAYEDHPFIPPLEDFIREAHAGKRPMIGICFGHQIIAQALGGKVEKFPGGWSVGRQEYDFGGNKLALNAWHQDQVTRRPEGAKLEASSEFCENAALSYGGHIFTLQPHPEFDEAMIDGLIRYRAPGLVPPPLIEQASQGLAQGTDSDLMARRMAEFFINARQDAHV
ncbi:MAG: type 1 glutamine amidotransferase [Rhodobacteraceae bacterium]|nr:type 1 glutamine amidotransferase [Paracoccaceae bacterium]